MVAANDHVAVLVRFHFLPDEIRRVSRATQNS